MVTLEVGAIGRAGATLALGSFWFGRPQAKDQSPSRLASRLRASKTVGGVLGAIASHGLSKHVRCGRYDARLHARANIRTTEDRRL
jgi:hypothetical protein